VKQRRPRIVALVPSTFLIDGEFCDIAETAGAQAHLFRVFSPQIDEEDAGEVADAARFMGTPALLARVAAEARQVSPDVAVWACTSGSFIDGGAMGDLQAEAMSAALDGIPAITTSNAMRAALNRLAAARVGVITPYHPEIGDRFVEFLERSGKTIVFAEHLGGGSDEAVGALPPEAFAAAVTSHDEAVDAIAIPCTAVSEMRVAPVLKTVSDAPLVFANRATIEEALRLVRS
jgi:maleate cis-trans isomerase